MADTKTLQTLVLCAAFMLSCSPPAELLLWRAEYSGPSQINYSMQMIKPDTGILHSLQIIEPADGVRYSMNSIEVPWTSSQLP